MKFKVLHSFKHGHVQYEAGNSHDFEDEQMIDVFHRAGWIEIAGRENNEINPAHSEVIADNVGVDHNG